MEDGDVLFRALVARREAIHNLLVSTSTLSEQLTGLVRQPAPTSSRRWSNLETVVKRAPARTRTTSTDSCG